jgi:hypothetical protein
MNPAREASPVPPSAAHQPADAARPLGGNRVNSLRAGRWRSRRAGGSLALLALFAALAGPAPAQARPDLGTGPFGLVPAPTAAGQPRSFFSLTIAPGRAARDTAVISNEGAATERLRVTLSRGVTAANSGSAFEGATRRCSGAGCWLSGLPATVTLAPGAREALPFRVAVPARTRPAQYLAGITAESAIRPRAVRVGVNGHASAKAIIIDQVTVGVAVTVGSLARLRTAVRISRVSAGWVGSTPRLYIPVHNSGQTFARATGTVSCRAAGRSRSYRVIMETVLPGGGAVLPVNAPGLTSGPVPCTVRLRAATGALITWSGVVSVPKRVLTRTYHPAKGVYVSLPESTVPPWAIALMVLGGLILFTLLTLLILRRHPARRASARRASAAQGRGGRASAGRGRAGRGSAEPPRPGRSTPGRRRPGRRTAT